MFSWPCTLAGHVSNVLQTVEDNAQKAGDQPHTAALIRENEALK